ncbi:MAG: hypothetical protein R3Y60_06155 [bacterium]
MFQLKLWFNENTPDDELNRLKEMATHACKHWNGDLQDESTDKYIMEFTSESCGKIGHCGATMGENKELIYGLEKFWLIFLNDNKYEDALKCCKRRWDE